jgi:hypothetical protein
LAAFRIQAYDNIFHPFSKIQVRQSGEKLLLLANPGRVSLQQFGEQMTRKWQRFWRLISKGGGEHY